jgi:hypothetical protein
VKRATISNIEDRTTEDPGSGAMRSVQAAEVSLPESVLRELWSPMYLERLARTYWRFLRRVTLGLVQVRYSETERSIVLIGRPFKLLTFAAPEYELAAGGGVVRWRITRGMLVARRGRGGAGHLQIEVRRLPEKRPGRARLRIEVEVANFFPAIASGFGRRVYNATQARVHVLVTHAFLRSLARLDLQESRVGRLAGTADRPAAAPDVPAGRSPGTGDAGERRWRRRPQLRRRRHERRRPGGRHRGRR